MTAAKRRVAVAMRAQYPPVSFRVIAAELGVSKTTVARNLAETVDGRVGGRVGGGWWGGPVSTAVAPAALPGQFVLDLPGLDAPAERPAPRRRARPVVEELPAALKVPAGQPGVWGVWDGEDLVGVYAEEQVARADAAVL